MMNGCISHIYIIIVGKALSDSRGKYLQETSSIQAKPMKSFFLKKPMPLIPNAILNKSTRCLIMCNVRVAIRENPDSHSTIDTTTASCGQAFIQMKHWIYSSIDILVSLLPHNSE